MQRPNPDSSDPGNPYSPPAAPSREALRKASAKRSAVENERFDQTIVRTLLGAFAVVILPGVLGLEVPVGALYSLLVLIGLAGAKAAGTTWPRRILYSVPFVTMTLGVLLGPAFLHTGGSAQIALFFLFSMIGVLPGLALYALVRFLVNRIVPPDVA
jgi:hypothetical protein